MILSNQIELKSCPFCGGKPLRKLVNLGEVYSYADKVVYTCGGCRVTRGAMGNTDKGGYADNSTVEERALKAWNMRPAGDDDLRRDAERYRWLRDGNAYAPEESSTRGGEDLDDLVDAALERQ